MTELSVSVGAGDNAEDSEILIRLVGEADVTTTVLGQTLRAEVAKKPRRIVIEAAQLTFIDSAAIHEIVLAHRRLQADGAQLVLRNPGPEVSRILQLTGLETVVTIQRSNDEASAS